MFIYEIVLASLLALFLVTGTSFGLLYNLLYFYLIARLATEAIRFYLAFQQGDFLFNQWPNLGIEYWLTNATKSLFFILIFYYVTDKLLEFQFPENRAFWLKIKMMGLPLLSIALLWIPTARSNWPQTIVMTLGCLGFISFLLMQKRVQFDNAVVLKNPLQQPAIVLSGGFSPLYNHHFFIQSQRYAADMVLQDYNRYAHQQRELSAFTSFGTPLLAPINGEVVAAQFDKPDQAIRTTDALKPVGNHIVIKTPQGLYVLLAHLQKNSGKVSVGQTVVAGDEIAAVGNSGNTSEPHLHIQVQNQLEFSQVTQTYPIYFESKEGTVFSRYKTVIE